MVDRNDLPLAILSTAANTADCKMFIETIDAIPLKRRPVKVHADKGYDSQALRDALGERGIADRIARRRVDSSEKLGCHRWVVERTHSWLNGFRRLKIRYERKAQMHQALLSLGCALICFRAWQRFWNLLLALQLGKPKACGVRSQSSNKYLLANRTCVEPSNPIFMAPTAPIVCNVLHRQSFLITASFQSHAATRSELLRIEPHALAAFRR